MTNSKQPVKTIEIKIGRDVFEVYERDVIRWSLPIVKRMAKLDNNAFKCCHTFWKDGRPENCFNCGLTKREIGEQNVIKAFLDYLEKECK